MRVNRDGKTQKTQHLPATVGCNTCTKEPQKIITSTVSPPVVVSPPILAFVKLPQLEQEDDINLTTYNQSVDNTQAKMLTWTLTQDFARQVMGEDIRTSQVKRGEV